jgi:hypothetical protein
MSPFPSRWRFTMRNRLLFALVTLLAAGGVAFALTASAPTPDREVTLLARGMAFYLPGDPTPNPMIAMQRGEVVRLVVRNVDAGLTHDVVVESLGIRSGEIRGAGAEIAVELRAPEAAGDHQYVCSLHAAMMRGTIQVR